jgi:hypothetical protein
MKECEIGRTRKYEWRKQFTFWSQAAQKSDAVLKSELEWNSFQWTKCNSQMHLVWIISQKLWAVTCEAVYVLEICLRSELLYTNTLIFYKLTEESIKMHYKFRSIYKKSEAILVTGRGSQGLWDIEDPTLSKTVGSLMAASSSALRTDRALLPRTVGKQT